MTYEVMLYFTLLLLRRKRRPDTHFPIKLSGIGRNNHRIKVERHFDSKVGFSYCCRTGNNTKSRLIRTCLMDQTVQNRRNHHRQNCYPNHQDHQDRQDLPFHESPILLDLPIILNVRFSVASPSPF